MELRSFSLADLVASITILLTDHVFIVIGPELLVSSRVPAVPHVASSKKDSSCHAENQEETALNETAFIGNEIHEVNSTLNTHRESILFKAMSPVVV